MHGRAVTLAEFAFIHGDIRFAHQIECRGQGPRGVHVVRKSRVELLCCFPDAHGHSILLASREFALLQPVPEIPQALHRTCRLLQAVEREIELLAVRNTCQCKSQR